MQEHLTVEQVVELAELFEDSPRRVGVVDQVLQAAAEGRGMRLMLRHMPSAAGDDRRAGRRRVDPSRGHGRR